MKKQIVTAVAALTLLTCVGGYGYSYASPKSYVALDINPSIKLTTNMYDKVIKVEPLNEEAEVIAKELKIKNKDIEEALKLLVAAATENGYLNKETDNAIMVTASSEAGEEVTDAILEDAEEAVNEELEVEEIEDAEVIKENVNAERFAEAERLGISPGKMNLLEKLKAASPDINVDEYADKSVKEIMKKIKEERSLDKKETEEIQETEQTTTEETVEVEATEVDEDTKSTDSVVVTPENKQEEKKSKEDVEKNNNSSAKQNGAVKENNSNAKEKNNLDNESNGNGQAQNIGKEKKANKN